MDGILCNPKQTDGSQRPAAAPAHQLISTAATPADLGSSCTKTSFSGERDTRHTRTRTSNAFWHYVAWLGTVAVAMLPAVTPLQLGQQRPIWHDRTADVDFWE
jgi:hypothetical protein